jgi:hypothetical protein
MLGLVRTGLGLTSIICLMLSGCADVSRSEPLVGDESSPCLRDHPDFRILFAGNQQQLLENFRSWESPSPSSNWVIDGNAVKTNAGRKFEDLVLSNPLSSFVLRFEFRVSNRGNSGVKYWVDGNGQDAVGYEYQIIDDQNHPDALLGRLGTRRTGSLYDIWPSHQAMATADTWASGCIMASPAGIEHWLNGRQVATIPVGDELFVQAFAESKFASRTEMMTRRSGAIFFQNHGEAVAFRNIKIRPY